MATVAKVLEEMKEFMGSTFRDISLYTGVFFAIIEYAIIEQYYLTPVSMIFVRFI